MIREVPTIPDDYLGSAPDEEGAERISDMMRMLGETFEIVKHGDTYYVVEDIRLPR